MYKKLDIRDMFLKVWLRPAPLSPFDSSLNVKNRALPCVLEKILFSSQYLKYANCVHML